MAEATIDAPETINAIGPFSDEREKALVNLVFTYNLCLDQTLHALQPFDINDQHYNVLKTIEQAGAAPISVGEIKRLLFNKRGDLTRLLDKLVALKLVVREVAAEDRRVVLVSISARGREQLAAMDQILAQHRSAGKQLSPSELAQLNALLDKFRS